MRRVTRFALGVSLGAGAVAVYLWFVGIEQVAARASAVGGVTLALVGVLVAAEAGADGLGVWGSVVPLGGLAAAESVQFALAGDFFDAVSPAGPATSEPIVARFLSVATQSPYSDALAVRAVAKYAKSGTQVAASGLLAVVLVVRGSPPRSILLVVAGLAVLLIVIGVVLLVAREPLAALVVFAVTPLVTRLPAWISSARDRSAVERAVDRFRRRIARFRERPDLLAVIGLGGLFEQALTALAMWVALWGTGVTVPLIPILLVIPLPQAGSVLPIPASLGAYDLLLAGAVTAAAGAPAANAAAAVLVVRTIQLPFALGVGGVAAALLRGWRPLG